MKCVAFFVLALCSVAYARFDTHIYWDPLEQHYVQHQEPHMNEATQEQHDILNWSQTGGSKYHEFGVHGQVGAGKHLTASHANAIAQQMLHWTPSQGYQCYTLLHHHQGFPCHQGYAYYHQGYPYYYQSYPYYHQGVHNVAMQQLWRPHWQVYY